MHATTSLIYATLQGFRDMLDASGQPLYAPGHRFTARFNPEGVDIDALADDLEGSGFRVGLVGDVGLPVGDAIVYPLETQ